MLGADKKNRLAMFGVACSLWHVCSKHVKLCEQKRQFIDFMIAHLDKRLNFKLLGITILSMNVGFVVGLKSVSEIVNMVNIYAGFHHLQLFWVLTDSQLLINVPNICYRSTLSD